MFQYNTAAPYQQYSGMGAMTLSPTAYRSLGPIAPASSGIPLWVWIAGGAVLAGGAYYFLVYKG